ncbi:hypothetical protein BX616_005215 [Lobosporangium transversale]|nr:hypothetical protein BX616_005215 [Lobosporangium transversale]
MENDIPTIDAIFVVRFDTRRGNVLEWSETTPGMEIKGVEFSALPSGIHSHSQDVIYFQLRGCIGVAVFANVPSENLEDRGAQMASVGVLVKPSVETGRCGQVWRHVDFLKSQARDHTTLGAEKADLANYFAQHKVLYHTTASSSSSNRRSSYRARNIRRISRSFTLSEPLQPLSSSPTGQHEPGEIDDIPISHPSHHFLRLVHTMGPAIYTIWKAALTRKRILICTKTPIEPSCLFVYNICLMATIPPGAISYSQTKFTERMQPLFCVGLHDIDNMQNIQGGYVACTTDKLFLFKPQLYDVLVDLSSTNYKSAYPRICIVNETLRENELEECCPNAIDKRRYFSMLQQLNRFRRRQEWMQRHLCTEAASTEAYEENEELSELSSTDMQTIECERSSSKGGFNMSDTLRKMVTGGWWWWYGGDGTEDDSLEPLITTPTSQADSEHLSGDRDRPLSGACLQVLQTRTCGSADTEAIRFFHNLTSTLLSDLGRLISFKTTAAIFDDDDDEPLSPDLENEISNRPIEISIQDLRQLGLDPYKDHEFVLELGRIYFGTRLQVQHSDWNLWCCRVTSCCSASR